MKRCFAALALALIVSGCAAGGTTMPRDSGAAPAAKTCGELQTCSADCSGADTTSCVRSCVEMGSTTAKRQWNELARCLEATCWVKPECTESTHDDKGCEKCTFDAQCAASAPCKTANEICVGRSPDPGCTSGASIAR